eukprot:4873990-Alexandrium_andersonii.AAC.1
MPCSTAGSYHIRVCPVRAHRKFRAQRSARVTLGCKRCKYSQQRDMPDGPFRASTGKQSLIVNV